MAVNISVTLHVQYFLKMEAQRQFRSFYDIIPEETYSVREAARCLGVHRCTMYAYIANAQRRLPFFSPHGSDRKLFRGTDLLAFKAGGLPKRGRKRKGRKG